MDQELIQQIDNIVADNIKAGLGKYLQQNLFGYQSPLNGMLKDAVEKMNFLPKLIQKAAEDVASTPEFYDELKSALSKRLVNDLVKSFGLEDALKQLRNDPESRKKILNLLETMVKS